jgi:hypothetical protein
LKKATGMIAIATPKVAMQVPAASVQNAAFDLAQRQAGAPPL